MGSRKRGVILDFDSTECYIIAMTDAEKTTRTFKTGWFSKAARKARIKDGELCEAIQEVMKGQADDLVTRNCISYH